MNGRLVNDGTYGYCEETIEPIEIPRLLVRPTAELSSVLKMVDTLDPHPRPLPRGSPAREGSGMFAKWIVNHLANSQ